MVRGTKARSPLAHLRLIAAISVCDGWVFCPSIGVGSVARCDVGAVGSPLEPLALISSLHVAILPLAPSVIGLLGAGLDPL